MQASHASHIMSFLNFALTFCALVLTFAAANVPKSGGKMEFKKLMNTTVNECKVQLQIPDGNLTLFFKTSNDSNLKCELIKCIDMKILGPFQTQDERLEKSAALIEDVYGENDELKNKMLEIFHKCSEKRGLDDCETILTVSRCFMHKAKELKDEIRNFFMATD